MGEPATATMYTLASAPRPVLPFALPALVGCVAPPSLSGGAAEQPTLPSAYDPELATTEELTPELEVFAEEAQALVERLRSLNSGIIPAIYEDAATWGDDRCPVYHVQSDTTAYWESICSTGDGASFHGDVFYSIVDGVDRAGQSYQRHELFTHSRITRADGASFRGAGNVIVGERSTEDGKKTFTSYTLGVFSATTELAEGEWISEGVENNLNSSYEVKATGAPQSASIDGSVGGLGGTYVAASFTNFKLGSAESGWLCEGEPSGSLSMRTEDGDWLTLFFETPDAQGSLPKDPSACDGCGTVGFEGERLGEVCLDLSPLLAWEDAPW